MTPSPLEVALPVFIALLSVTPFGQPFHVIAAIGPCGQNRRRNFRVSLTCHPGP
jgi:hypothetical protein